MGMYGRYRFSFNVTAAAEFYTLSLHDALPISGYSYLDLYLMGLIAAAEVPDFFIVRPLARIGTDANGRSEEHTSELQSRLHLVCRLLLEKKNNVNIYPNNKTLALSMSKSQSWR